MAEHILVEVLKNCSFYDIPLDVIITILMGTFCAGRNEHLDLHGRNECEAAFLVFVFDLPHSK